MRESTNNVKIRAVDARDFGANFLVINYKSPVADVNRICGPVAERCGQQDLEPPSNFGPLGINVLDCGSSSTGSIKDEP